MTWVAEFSGKVWKISKSSALKSDLPTYDFQLHKWEKVPLKYTTLSRPTHLSISEKTCHLHDYLVLPDYLAVQSTQMIFDMLYILNIGDGTQSYPSSPFADV